MASITFLLAAARVANLVEQLDNLEGGESDDDAEIVKAFVESKIKKSRMEEQCSSDCDESDLDAKPNESIPISTRALAIASLRKRRKCDRESHKADFLELDDKQFQIQLNFTRGSFDKVLELLSPQFKEKGMGRPGMPLQKQLLVFIWLLTHQEPYSCVAQRFHTSKSGIEMCFKRIVAALVNISGEIIAWPKESAVEKTVEGLKKIAGFPDTIGVIDRTHIAIKTAKKDRDSYTNSRGYTSILLQAVCDSDLKFTDCFCGYPGSVSDFRRMFASSVLYQNITNNRAEYFPNNTHLLGNLSYPLSEWLMTSLQDREVVTPGEEAYNKSASATLHVAARAFALLKRRFVRLKLLDMNRIDLVPTCVVAACVLHNICLMQNEDVTEYLADPIEDENEDDVPCVGDDNRLGGRIKQACLVQKLSQNA